MRAREREKSFREGDVVLRERWFKKGEKGRLRAKEREFAPRERLLPERRGSFREVI